MDLDGTKEDICDHTLASRVFHKFPHMSEEQAMDDKVDLKL